MGLALIEKIIALFLMLFAGFALVKKDVLKKEDSQTLSKLCLYLISPCVLFHAFTVEVTPERQRAFFLCGVLALGIQGFFTLFIFFLDKIFPMTVVEKTAVIYSNCGNIIIPIVAYALGEDYLIYITAYIGVYNILLWTHGISLFKRQLKKAGGKGKFKEENFRDSEEDSLFEKLSGFLKNPNILAIIFGFLCFSFRIDLPRPLG
ncbi:AEC family transporter, partial [Oribacterium sinus]